MLNLWVSEKNKNVRPLVQTLLRLFNEALKTEQRREATGKGEKERYTDLNAEFQKIARRDKKAFLSDQCKELEETIEWQRIEISSRKLEIPREYFMQRWAR